jgi:hypothetical protein
MTKFYLTLLVFLGSSFNLLNLPCFASEPNSDQYPCIEDICLRDDIKKLSQIKWMSADQYLVRGQPPKSIGNTRNIQAFAPYWNGGVLDIKGIKIRSGIKGFCEPRDPNSFTASYLAKDRRLIIVTFGIQFSDSGKSQTFVVRHISKVLYIGQTTRSQKQALEVEARRKYPTFYGDSRPLEPNVHVYETGKGLVLDLSLPTIGSKGFGNPSRDSMFSFPGCGGETPIKLE